MKFFNAEKKKIGRSAQKFGSQVQLSNEVPSLFKWISRFFNVYKVLQKVSPVFAVLNPAQKISENMGLLKNEWLNPMCRSI